MQPYFTGTGKIITIRQLLKCDPQAQLYINTSNLNLVVTPSCVCIWVLSAMRIMR